MKRNSLKIVLTITIKEKSVMKNLRRTLPIILSAVAILGTLAVSGHAKKPAPSPVPTLVEVTGAIKIKPNGQGDPARVQVEFVDPSLLTYVYPHDDATQGPVFISNPDRQSHRQPSLYVIRIAGSMQTSLRYWYCTHKDHVGTEDLLCEDPVGHENYYYCLTIGHGITQTKHPGNYDHVIFPVGSPWSISSKETLSVVKEGTISIETTYDVIE